MQSLRILTLRLTIAYRGSGHVWKTAVRDKKSVAGGKI